jgi:hypothetical protein
MMNGDITGLQGPKAANTRDRKRGNTPLHIAVEENNFMAVQTLLALKTLNSKLPNTDGETARDIAKRLRYENILNLLDNRTTNKVGNNRNIGSDLKGAQPVDQERIMKIWETFFENAFKYIEDESKAVDGLVVGGGYERAESNVKSQYYNNTTSSIGEDKVVTGREDYLSDWLSTDQSLLNTSQLSNIYIEPRGYEHEVRFRLMLNLGLFLRCDWKPMLFYF